MSFNIKRGADMPFLPQDYNPAEYDTDFSSPGLLPEGTYLAAASKVEEKASKANPANRYIELTFSVLDGPHRGVTKSRLNMVNANATAALIARKELSAICQAVGFRPQAYEDLIDRPLVIVVVNEQDNQGNMQSRICEYRPAQTWQSPAVANVAPVQVPTPAQSLHEQHVAAQYQPPQAQPQPGQYQTPQQPVWQQPPQQPQGGGQQGKTPPF